MGWLIEVLEGTEICLTPAISNDWEVIEVSFLGARKSGAMESMPVEMTGDASPRSQAGGSFHDLLGFVRPVYIAVLKCDFDILLRGTKVLLLPPCQLSHTSPPPLY